MRTKLKLRKFSWLGALLVLTTLAVPKPSSAQDQDQEDPPSRVARLGYMEGSVSFQPAGEEDWVGAVDNRPMTTGDKLWADKDSRAEVQLGSAVIRLAPETGFSFLNLDDSTVQIQLTSGSINITVRNLENNDDFEVDTPNLAFTVSQPGHYRFDASEDGSNTVVTIREGEGQATGNGQTYTLHAGQAGTFSGTDSLTADVEQIGNADQFDSWSETRDHRHDYSRSSHYLAPDVVGYDDLDDNGDWRDDSNYGHVWFPNHVDEGWAPYHEGHWDWISPWGWTWVDDSSWGYAPFHYGRWVSVSGRWGWVAGPVAVHAVYAPALVVFIGGGPGGFGGNVGWFPLGPREVYVPSYHVSEAYVNRVNVSNTTVNVTQVTNVYNTTIVHNTTNITNVTYANRGVQGAVMVVPQHAFTSAQPVAKARVQVSPQQIAAAPVSGRVAVAPTRESVLGAKSSTAGHVTAPPAAVASRQVVARKTPPPPPVPFAKQQQALAAHPGQPLAKQEVQSLRPANTAASHPMVKQAPPGKPATPTTGHPANSGRPGQPASASPANQPGTPPAAANERPAETNRPAPAQPNNRPQPTQPNNRPEATPNRPAEPPARNDRPPAAQPNNRPAPTQPNNQPPATQPNKPEANPNRPPAAQPSRPDAAPNRPPAAQPDKPEVAPNRPPAAQPSRPEAAPNRPPAAQPNKPEAAPNRPPAAQPNNRPEPTPPPARNDRPPAAQPAPRQTPPPSDRPQQHAPPPAGAKPAPAPPKQQAKPQTPEEKKKQEEQKKPQ